MGDVSAYSDVAYLFFDSRKKEEIMLMSVITPPKYYIILTKRFLRAYLVRKGKSGSVVKPSCNPSPHAHNFISL